VSKKWVLGIPTLSKAIVSPLLRELPSKLAVTSLTPTPSSWAKKLKVMA